MWRRGQRRKIGNKTERGPGERERERGKNNEITRPCRTKDWLINTDGFRSAASCSGGVCAAVQISILMVNRAQRSLLRLTQAASHQNSLIKLLIMTDVTPVFFLVKMKHCLMLGPTMTESFRHKSMGNESRFSEAPVFLSSTGDTAQVKLHGSVQLMFSTAAIRLVCELEMKLQSPFKVLSTQSRFIILEGSLHLHPQAVKLS